MLKFGFFMWDIIHACVQVVVCVLAVVCKRLCGSCIFLSLESRGPTTCRVCMYVIVKEMAYDPSSFIISFIHGAVSMQNDKLHA